MLRTSASEYHKAALNPANLSSKLATALIQMNAQQWFSFFPPFFLNLQIIWSEGYSKLYYKVMETYWLIEQNVKIILSKIKNEIETISP